MGKKGNGNVVWSENQGWHDGPPSHTYLDENGNLQSVVLCREPYCRNPVARTDNGERVMVGNTETPFCREHVSEWARKRLTDPEAWSI